MVNKVPSTYNFIFRLIFVVLCNASKNVKEASFSSYRNQSKDSKSKSIDWFQYDGKETFITFFETLQSRLKNRRSHGAVKNFAKLQENSSARASFLITLQA